MSYYGMIWPSYFDGPTGREIVRLGGAAAQACGVYLASAHEANMIGLYRLPLAILRVRLGWKGAASVEKAVSALSSAGFSDYDRLTECVWVREMAFYRLGLDEKPLHKDDNRVTHVRRLYEQVEPNPFLPLFFARYRDELHLKKERAYDGPMALLRFGSEAPSQAPLKPVTESEPVPEPDPGTAQIGSSALAKIASPEPSPSVLAFPVVGPKGPAWTLTEAHLHSLMQFYPTVDVLQQCRNACAWIHANPGKRKTASGMSRFLTTWLNRATNTSPANGYRTNGHQSAAAHTMQSARQVLDAFGTDDGLPPPLELEP